MICSGVSVMTSETPSTTIPTITVTDINNNHDCLTAIFDIIQMKLDAQIDDRHDHATKVCDPFDEVRRIGNARDILVATNFLHLENIDGIFFIPQ